MRHNNRISTDRYDRVYISAPQCPWLYSIVATPLKAIYYNVDAENGANIVKLFNNMWDLEEFVGMNEIKLG